MAASSDDKSLAVYCDFENVALGVRDAKYQKFDIHHILERLLVKGSIVVKKAYCDWDRYKNFKGAMHEAAFELIEIPHVRVSGKNSADIRMVVDALDLCYTKSHVDTFVIISGDSDFSPLVSKLRENAKTVIGVGVKNSTSDLLISSCDEFIYYDDLVRELEKKAPRRKRASKKRASSRARSEPKTESGAERAGNGEGRGESNGEGGDGVSENEAGVEGREGSGSGDESGTGSGALKEEDQIAANGDGKTSKKTAAASSSRSRRGGRRSRTEVIVAEEEDDAGAEVKGEEPSEVGETSVAPARGKSAAKRGSKAAAKRGARAAPKKDGASDGANETKVIDIADALPFNDAAANEIRGEEAEEPDTDEDGEESTPEELAQEGLDMVLETALALSSERGGADKLWGSMVKQTLKRRRPGFNETYYGYESFGKMLEEAAARGYLDLEHDDRSGGYIITRITA